MRDFLKNIFDFWALTSFFKFESVDQPRYASLFCQVVGKGATCGRLELKIKINENKNTMTGPANCKETTRHHAHLSLCAKSRKGNNAKSRK